jgi:hypothetical protein
MLANSVPTFEHQQRNSPYKQRNCHCLTQQKYETMKYLRITQIKYIYNGMTLHDMVSAPHQ